MFIYKKNVFPSIGISTWYDAAHFVIYRSLKGFHILHTTLECLCLNHSDVIVSTMASQIAGDSIACSTVYLCVDQRKHLSSASLAFVMGIHRWPVNFLPKEPATRKCFHLAMSSWWFANRSSYIVSHTMCTQHSFVMFHIGYNSSSYCLHYSRLINHWLIKCQWSHPGWYGKLYNYQAPKIGELNIFP